MRGVKRESHGKTGTPLHNIWLNMKDRCNNPNNFAYDRYGGRGIKVCERWDSFENFEADMGPRPSPAHTIDRKDGNGNYEPANCRWATWQEQNRNTSANARDEDGTLILDIAVETGVSLAALYHRYRKGLRGEQLRRLTKPAERRARIARLEAEEVQ